MYKKNKKEITKFDRFVGIIFFLWFIASVIALFYFADREEPKYIIVVFGQLFFIFGLMFMRSQLRSIKVNKQAEEKYIFKTSKLSMIVPPLLFIIVGLTCMIGPIVVDHPEVIALDIDWNNVIILSSMFVFLLFGLGLCMSFFKSMRIYADHRLIKLQAIVVALDEKRGDTQMIYAPILRYTFEGKEYQHTSSYYSNVGVPKIGSTITIKINPMEPKEVYFKNYGNIILLIIGLAFMSLPAFIIIEFIKTLF